MNIFFKEKSVDVSFKALRASPCKSAAAIPFPHTTATMREAAEYAPLIDASNNPAAWSHQWPTFCGFFSAASSPGQLAEAMKN